MDSPQDEGLLPYECLRQFSKSMNRFLGIQGGLEQTLLILGFLLEKKPQILGLEVLEEGQKEQILSL
jgi:hypothetical protein